MAAMSIPDEQNIADKPAEALQKLHLTLNIQKSRASSVRG